MTEHILGGGSQNEGHVVRVGDTVRRPRRPGYQLVEALLVHLERVGFEGAPRFLGLDESGRQVLDYVEGAAHRNPPWQQDDEVNATRLGTIAKWLQQLHRSSASFVPPLGEAPARPLPITGSTWTHGDVGYPNIVYAGDRITALIDWEFAAPAHRCCDPAGLLAISVRGPRPDVADNDRRALATRKALASVASGYEMTDEEVQSLPQMAATILDDSVIFQTGVAPRDELERMMWRASWFRDNADWLVG